MDDTITPPKNRNKNKKNKRCNKYSIISYNCTSHIHTFNRKSAIKERLRYREQTNQSTDCIDDGDGDIMMEL